MISLIIPVLNESESLPKLLERICHLDISEKLEIIILDDSHDDLTKLSTQPFLDKLPLTYHHSKSRQGLSSTVIKGFEMARSDILICIDGDGSHPVEKIEELAERIKKGESMVVASRNITGGGASKHWSRTRKIISKLCCWMVSPLTNLHDPMSGFFAISSEYYQQVRGQLKPISYKIGLELAVKGRLHHIPEIPYTFEERIAGKSKVNTSVALGMIYHFMQLYTWRLLRPKNSTHTNQPLLKI